ncbi:hypothetical protein B2J93_1582 [Marssonina coronariae]|uniref:Uncharacterized protein n=1 Tax=Diplocarpon coronariae TaxID=2795749 RepID=A0A218YX40_9HELO|nr:hypothetical protein B2J93_1582 [Marssonina coronariae]
MTFSRLVILLRAEHNLEARRARPNKSIIWILATEYKDADDLPDVDILKRTGSRSA